MVVTRIEIIPKHGEWIVKLNLDVYLGPYSYDDAMVTAVALANVAWQLGRRAEVVLENPKGVHRTVWDHPAQRHEMYA